jgi:predicted ATP-binding protein involved in virulence
MRIDSLNVKNIRLFGDNNQTITFDRSKNVTILLGDNGAGKTSLLYGCSVLLSQFYKHFPNCSVRNFTENDVRNISNERKSDYLHVGITIVPTNPEVSEYMDCDVVDAKEQISVQMYKKGNETDSTPPSELKAISDYSLRIKTKIDNNEAVALPVIAYYGTERGQIKPVERRRDFNEIFPRWDIYRADSLDSATDFKRFFTWFERNEDLERREQLQQLKRTGTSTYSSHVLDAVRSALNRLFPDYLQNPRVETSPLRFVMDDIRNPDNPIEHRLERMSDGYRITIALVADIAARLAEANPSREVSGLDDPLQANGVVMIDEIDLHLHPKLQREILARLTGIFPNVQFIVSTHSPNVVIGALDFVQLVKLDCGVIDDSIDEEKYDTYDISLLLLSDLFDEVDVRTHEYLRLSNSYEELLSKSVLSDEDKAEIDRLGKILKGFSSDDIWQFKKMLSKIQHHD